MKKYKQYIYGEIIPSIGNFFKQRKKIRCIYYHNIVSDRPGESFQHIELKKFEDQMFYLKNSGYKTLTFKEMEEMEKREHKINKNLLVTFDDGFKSNYTMAFPFMKKLGLKFNIFLRIDKIDNDEDYLTWNMIREMHESGLVGFGAHTYSHISSVEINSNNYEKEINYANQAIKQITGEPVEDFCFPYGYYDDKTIQLFLAKKTYKRLYTSDYRDSVLSGECRKIGRYGISNNDSIKVFINKLRGNYDILYYKLVRLHKKG